MLFEDLLGSLGRHLFDLDATLAGDHQHGASGAAIQNDTQIQLAGNIAALFHQQLMHDLAFRSGLDGDQFFSEQSPGHLLSFVRAPDQLHTSLGSIVQDGPFAATARMDLRFDDSQTAAQFLERFGRFGRRADHDSRQHGHARIAENMFRLELVNLHWRTPSIRSGGTIGWDCKMGAAPSQACRSRRRPRICHLVENQPLRG